MTNSNGAGPTLQVHPTRRCNLACGHCSTSSGPQVQEELPRELLHAAIKDAAHLGYEQLDVSGGEPFLYDGLPGLLARARRLDYVTRVTTNGMLLGQTRRWAPVAPLIDELIVSVDGPPAEHDELRGRPGLHDLIVRNLEVVRAARVPLAIAFTLSAESAPHLEAMVRFAAEQGAHRLLVRPFSLTGRAAAGTAGIRPDGFELTAAIAEAQRCGGQLGIVVDVDAVTRDELVLYRGQYVPLYPTRDLAALAPVLVIGADGAVRPLSHRVPARLALGSLHRHRLARLAPHWLSSDAAAELASTCDRTWWELADPKATPAAAWTEELTARLPRAVQPALVAA